MGSTIELNTHQQALLTQFTNLGIESKRGREAMKELLVDIDSQEINKGGTTNE